MKKALDTSHITSELAGASAFFKPAPTTVTAQPPATQAPRPKSQTSLSPVLTPTPPKIRPQTTRAGRLAKNAASLPVSKDENMDASMLASDPASIIETIRKAVKHSGREVTYVRLTPEEKSNLSDIVYTYKRQGVKTSENEIGRIAIAYLLEDYKGNGEESILAKVLAALLA